LRAKVSPIPLDAPVINATGRFSPFVTTTTIAFSGGSSYFLR
jgi:hypothetical protein